ncbi:MAG: hypothetical protein IKX44_03020 [Prevotella sp.]|nr:hypothetical protein [Prevotella sp.]
MKKIAYQTPVIKTLTMEFLMQSASGGSGATGEMNGETIIGDGGIDDDGSLDPDAKIFGTHSVWDD